MPLFPPSPTQLSAPIDLRRVRQLFSVPSRVAASDFLRREISTRMHERLALVKIAPHQVLDAGCGEGADLPVLRKHFADAHIIGIDASPAMLRVAHDRQDATLSTLSRTLVKWLTARMQSSIPPNSSLLCGDFAQLPIDRESVDLIWSNLALHWHPQPDWVLTEWHRVLQINGLLMFSCFGPDTFKELRMAFTMANVIPPILPFVDMHDFGDMLVNVGFSTPVMDMETITVTYESVDRLMTDMRAWGGNSLATRARGLMGVRIWKCILQMLERMRDTDGKIPLTFEIIYGHAFRPVSRKTTDGKTIIRLDLRKPQSSR